MPRVCLIAAAAALAAVCLAGCGKSEGEIRAEERARIFEDMAKNNQQAGSPATETTQAASATAAAQVSASQPLAIAAAPKQENRIRSEAAPAGRLIETYSAYIGDDDLYNSSGDRLTQPWAILRQDRANFHRFGKRQGADQPDSFFASEANRAIMERMLRNGKIESSAALQVVRGNALVVVEIYGAGNRGEYVHVSVN